MIVMTSFEFLEKKWRGYCCYYSISFSLCRLFFVSFLQEMLLFRGLSEFHASKGLFGMRFRFYLLYQMAKEEGVDKIKDEFIMAVDVVFSFENRISD